MTRPGRPPVEPGPVGVRARRENSRLYVFRSADVEALVRSGADVAAVLAFLREHEPSHIAAFSRVAQRALLT